MDVSSGMTAAQWLATVDENLLKEVIRDYGEERFAKQIARAVVAARAIEPIHTTRQLVELVSKAVRTREPGQNPATRTFQAIRIYLNQELEELARVLPECVTHLKTGGRLVVISFHSLEDRIVKHFMRDMAEGDKLPRNVPIRASEVPQGKLNLIGRAVRAGGAEQQANPRARSAVMRVAERMKTDMVGVRKQALDKIVGLSPAYRGLLLVAVVLCALSVVTSQHKARKLFIELQKEKELAQRMDVEWGQLQLEQSTWATPARVEEVAVKKLQMQLPKNGQVQFIRVRPNGGANPQQ
jgi:cell division protein FtsL